MTVILHRIRAILFPNLLTEDTGDFYAKVISERALGISDICESAVTRGNAPTSAEAMKINVELFFKEMEYQLKDGYSVNTGYFIAVPQVKDVFRHISDKFDKLRHSVYFLFNQGEILRRGLEDIEIEITGVGEAGILISEVIDVKTGSVSDRITPNRNLRIRGAKLKLAGEDPNVGVYFVNETTGEQIKTEADEIVDNKPSEPVIVIPQSDAGLYTLKVVSQYTNGALLKEPRRATFDVILTVWKPNKDERNIRFVQMPDSIDALYGTVSTPSTVSANDEKIYSSDN
jgi:vacuolar-type H+-ATPase subunit F/Vma7